MTIVKLETFLKIAFKFGFGFEFGNTLHKKLQICATMDIELKKINLGITSVFMKNIFIILYINILVDESFEYIVLLQNRK